MKKIFLIILIIAILVAGIWLINKLSKSSLKSISISQCQFQEITFYYLNQCGWCQKVKNEGTIDKIEALGVKMNKINADIGPIRHKFEGLPAFVINNKVYSGYKTFEQLRELLGCPKIESQFLKNQNQPQILPEIQFFGEKGEKVNLENGKVKLTTLIFNNNQTQFYNVKMPDGKTIYFFVVKDKNGIYRAAANACAVCFKTYKGFRQEGDEIVCNNCGNRYPIEKIATEKGGCNPGPINPNLEVKNDQIIIKQSDLEQVLNLF
jgi:uncharacterized protein YbaR (Trm112 family)